MPSPRSLPALAVCLLASLLVPGAGCARLGLGGDDRAPRRDRFAIAGLEEAQVRVALERLQRALVAEDADAVAALVSFPLRVGGRRVRTPQEMARDYRAIWTPSLQRLVLAQRVEELFVNVQGVMLGDGAVWLGAVCAPGSARGECRDPQVRVVAVNPELARR